MMTSPETLDLFESCQRLLQLAQAQAQALEAEDFDAYQQLATERDRLHPVFEQPIPPPARAPVLTILTLVADLDRENVALVRGLIAETGQLLNQIRQGQGALSGYARPVAHLAAYATRVDATR